MRFDKNYTYLFAGFFVLTLIYLLAEYILTNHQFGVPLDDTWIHFRFAENFANGHFFQYNIGEPTPGTTSPLWVVILSIPFLISPNIYIPFTLVVGSLFFLLTCIETYKLSAKLGFNPNYSLIITFLTLLNGRLLWSSLSGMEITLCCYLIVLITRIHLLEIEKGKINVTTGLLLGLSVVTRPECYLFAAIYYILSLIFLRKNLKSNIGLILFSILFFLIIILPYPFFCYATTGSFLPNTFKGQDAGLRLIPDFKYLMETARLFIKDNIVIFLLWLASIIYFIRSIFKKKIENKFLFINLWISLLPLVSSFIAPTWRHHGRYLIPLIPFINIASINIFAKTYERLKRWNVHEIKVQGTIFLVILFILSGIGAFVYGRALGWNSDNINEQQVKIAYWLKQNLPNEKCFAINDIGAITFITDKRIIDMEGLVSPEFLRLRNTSDPESNDKMMKIFKANNVNYLIIYIGHEWFEGLYNKFHFALEKVYSSKLDNNTICGEAEMFVFKIHWEKLNY